MNKNPMPENQGTEPKSGNASTRAKPCRKITTATIAGMAKLVAKMLTESEACRRLGIKPQAWFDFKARGKNDEKWNELLEAYTAHRVEALIDRVEDSAYGLNGVKYPDFRAALALLKFTDKKRFGDSPVEITNQTITIDKHCLAGLRMAYAKPLPVQVEVKQIGQAGVVDESKPVETVSAFTDKP
jgi:hypothetical protein